MPYPRQVLDTLDKSEAELLLADRGQVDLHGYRSTEILVALFRSGSLTVNALARATDFCNSGQTKEEYRRGLLRLHVFLTAMIKAGLARHLVATKVTTHGKSRIVGLVTLTRSGLEASPGFGADRLE